MTENTKYYTIVTQAGFDKLQSYYRQEKILKLTHMGVGGEQDVYVAPSMSLASVPHEWTRLPLERHPDEGFVGGGATISNQEVELQGHFVSNVGIYDEDGVLILISSLPQFEISPDASVVSVYPIDIFTVLDNAEHVQVVTDTSINHPTYDEFNSAIEKLSRYATTEKSGLIELATQQEVSSGIDDKRAVTPSTLKHELDAIKDDIDNQGTELSKYATTESAGLIELATQEEVNAGTDPLRAVTAKTLNKQGLIEQLQNFAIQKANKVKEDIYGGVPASTLDTIKEISDALKESGDAIQILYELSELKLSKAEFNGYKNSINNKLNAINQSIAKLAPRVTVFNGRHATFTIPNITGTVVTFTLQSQRDGSMNNPKLGKAAECTFILIGSNQIERIGYWFVQQSRTQFSEFIVSAMIHGDNVVFTVEEQYYNSNSSHEPTTPSFTSTACHFKDIVVRV